MRIPKKIADYLKLREKKGSPDPVADTIAELYGVASATVVDVRRTVG